MGPEESVATLEVLKRANDFGRQPCSVLIRQALKVHANRSFDRDAEGRFSRYSTRFNCQNLYWGRVREARIRPCIFHLRSDTTPLLDPFEDLDQVRGRSHNLRL